MTCGPRYTLEEIEILKREYPDGGTLGVRKVLNRSGDSIRHTAKKLGIRYSHFGKGNRLDCEELIDPAQMNPQSVYILGLLWADGTVFRCPNGRCNTVSLTLVDSDFSDIGYLFTKWKFSVITHDEYPSWNVCYRATLCHKRLASFLEDNDFVLKSAQSPHKILNVIPSLLHSYFYRGWFDGDGSNKTLWEGNTGVNIAGSFEQDWSVLWSLCQKMEIKGHVAYSKGKKGKGSNFYFNGLIGTTRFLQYIYSDTPEMGLSRKRLTWEMFKAKQLFDQLDAN